MAARVVGRLEFSSAGRRVVRLAEGLVGQWGAMWADDSADLLGVKRAGAWAAWRADEMAGLSACWWAVSWAVSSVVLWVDVMVALMVALWVD